MTVTTPPRRPEIEPDRDLEEHIAELEALIEEARRRARRRRMRNGAAAALVAAGIVMFISVGGRDGGGGVAAALAPLPGALSPVPDAGGTPPLDNLPTGIGVNSFAFDPSAPDTVYAAAMGALGGNSRGYVYKTVDGGEHWHPTATTGAGWTRADALASDVRRPGTLYAGNTFAVYKTIDGGRSWHPWKRGLFPPPGPVRDTHVGTPGTTSWNRDEGHVTEIAVDPARSNIVYAATDTIRKSIDGGHTWKTVFQPTPIDRVYLDALVIAATRPQTIYTTVNEWHTTSIYKSTNAGATWHTSGGRGGAFGTTHGFPTALAVDPQQPTTVYAAIHDTLFKTTNAGANWQPIMHIQEEHFGDYLSSVAVDPQQPDTVYVGVHGGRHTGAIYETNDGGRTWRLAVSTVAVDAVAVNPSRPTTVYAAGWAGPDATYGNTFRLLRSTDRGRTWTIAR